MYADHLEEFRNLLYYRLGPGSTWLERTRLGLARRLFPPRLCLVIACPSVAPGLVIKHGLDTVIEAEKIGENCLIFHDVYIGMKDWSSGRPTLGSYVHVSAGAKIMGKVIIGDHSVIAANSVVTKDMPPNSLAMGIPARINLNAGNKGEYIDSGDVPAEALAEA